MVKFPLFSPTRIYLPFCIILLAFYGCMPEIRKEPNQNNVITEDPPTSIGINEKIKLLEDSLSKTPADISLLNEICFLYASNNDIRALEIGNKMISIKNVEKAAALGHFNRGVYYSNTSKIDSAIYEFGAAIDEDYQMIDAYIEKSILLYDKKQFDASYSLLEKATVINKYVPSLYFWMAKNRQEQGKKDDALYFYQQCLELKPTEDEALEATEMIKKLKQ